MDDILDIFQGHHYHHNIIITTSEHHLSINFLSRQLYSRNILLEVEPL